MVFLTDEYIEQLHDGTSGCAVEAKAIIDFCKADPKNRDCVLLVATDATIFDKVQHNECELLRDLMATKEHSNDKFIFLLPADIGSLGARLSRPACAN
eukprot:m.110333 g.110333  ORF g.110333 m.110333 type:complete len:98 (+) comp16037_c0_seq3:2316-2609(+)